MTMTARLARRYRLDRLIPELSKERIDDNAVRLRLQSELQLLEQVRSLKDQLLPQRAGREPTGGDPYATFQYEPWMQVTPSPSSP